MNLLTQNSKLKKTSKEWLEITEEVFQSLFKNSAVKRAGFEKLKKTIHLLKPES
jgi:epoxyqueuosine reductase